MTRPSFLFARPNARSKCSIASFAACTLFALLAMLAAGSAAAQPELEKLPGFVDADSLGIRHSDEQLKLEVNLVGAPIRFMAELLRGEDPELADALSRLESVRFRLYELEETDRAGAREQARGIARTLERRGWQQIVRLQDEGQQAALLLKFADDDIVGLVGAFVSSDGNFGYINIAGEIDPAQLGRIGRQLDIDLLEDAHQELERSEQGGDDS